MPAGSSPTTGTCRRCSGWARLAWRVATLAGFDLFTFPSNAALIDFDLEGFAARQAQRGRRLGWRAVLSHHEQFGTLAAALVAERLGLPGASPESILAAQHKLHARRVLQQVAPEANLAFEELQADYGADMPHGLGYPRFVKPVKAAFSVLARQVNGRDELQQHTNFGRWELWVIRHLVEPFERVCRVRLPQAGSAHRMLLEEPVPARVAQYNLDGWVGGGEVHALGVVDALMYPGTQSFMRWEFPSRLPVAVQAQALDVSGFGRCPLAKGVQHNVAAETSKRAGKRTCRWWRFALRLRHLLAGNTDGAVSAHQGPWTSYLRSPNGGFHRPPPQTARLEGVSLWWAFDRTRCVRSEVYRRGLSRGHG